jgi:hypothetical protein
MQDDIHNRHGVFESKILVRINVKYSIFIRYYFQYIYDGLVITHSAVDDVLEYEVKFKQN